LNFHYCQRALTDEALQALGQAIPSTLDTLHLDLRYGEQLTSSAVRDLFRMIKERAPDLRDFFVNCNHCILLTDAAVPAVLPSKLVRLRIGFGFCTRLSPVAVKTLARAMNDEIGELAFDFSDCCDAIPVLSAFQDLIDELPLKLQRIELTLMGLNAACTQDIEEAVKSALAPRGALVFISRPRP